MLLIGGITYWFVFRKDANPFSASEANFTVADTSKISAIYMASMSGEDVKLSRDQGEWKLNGKYKARPDAINNLLEALVAQKPEQAVPSSYHDGVIKDLSTYSTKIEVYHGNTKTHSFYVGSNPGVNNVTYMLNEGAKRPYIVKLNLSNTFLGVRYFTKAEEWRDRKIMYKNAPIELISVAYKDSVHYSYKIDVAGKSVTGNKVISEPLNAKRVDAYIRLQNEIYCMGFENKNALKDSIIQYGRKLADVTIKRQGVDADKLTIYFRPPSRGTKATLKLDGKEYDFDFFFGLVNETDFVLLNRKTTEKMLRSYPEFYQADQQVLSQ